MAEPYGRWLEGLNSFLNTQQSPDRRSTNAATLCAPAYCNEGVTAPWMGQYAVCVRYQYLNKSCLALLTPEHRTAIENYRLAPAASPRQSLFPTKLSFTFCMHPATA